jgi:hypothetical protein
MSDIVPTLRNLIACEDIRIDPASPRKASLLNLLSTIRSLEEPPYPLLYRELCVFVQLTECRGAADVALTIANEDSGALAYPGPARPWRANLPNAPLEIVGLPFRIRNILFAEAGMYWIQFWYNDKVLGQQPLMLR